MPKIIKQISQVVRIPDKWVYEDDGESHEFELGGGVVKVFSVSEQDFAEIQDRAYDTTFSGGNVAVRFSNKISNELVFSARLGKEKGAWEGFFGPDDEPLNCTVENQKKFAHFQGLRLFVNNHVGPMLDKVANNKAEESEKNLLKSLSMKPAEEKPRQGTEVAEVVN